MIKSTVMNTDASCSSDDGNSIFNKITTEFKNDVIKETLKLQFSDSKSKISEEAVELTKEIAKVMVVEAAIRAAKQANIENRTTVTLNHVENVLPQMMLDFP